MNKKISNALYAHQRPKKQYVDAESSRKVLKIAANFRKPVIVFKRKVTVSGGRRVIGIPEEIDRALGKKENVDLWLEGNKMINHGLLL